MLRKFILAMAGIWMIPAGGWAADAPPAKLDAEINRYVYSKYPYGTRLVTKGRDEGLIHLSGRHALPRLSPDRQQVLLTSFYGGTEGVWLVEVKGRDAKRIGDGRQGAWSGGGKTIALVRDGRIVVRDLATGAERHPLPPDWNTCSFPDLSRDGGTMVFLAARDGQTGLFALVGDGAPSMLAPSVAASAPRLSPDGRQVVFQAGAHLKVAELAAGTVRELPCEGGFQSFPVWSNDGRGVAYFQSLRPDGQAQLRIRDLEQLLEPQVLPFSKILNWHDLAGYLGEPGGDLDWTMKAAPDGIPESLKCELRNDHLVLSLAGEQATIRSSPGGDLAAVTRHFHHVGFPQLAAGDDLMVSGEFAAVIVPDRLGDDLLVRGAADASFSPLALGLLKSRRAMIVVIATAPRRRLTIGKDLTITAGGGPVYVGLIVADQDLWHEADTVAELPFDALWRVIDHGRETPRRAMMIPGATKELTELLAEARKANPDLAPNLAYPFYRTLTTPAHIWTVMDVVIGALGPEPAWAVCQQAAIDDFHCAGQRTTWPTVELTVHALRGSVGNQFMFERIPAEFAAWCAEAMAMLEAQEARLDEFGAFLPHLQRLAPSAAASPPALAQQLTELLAQRADMPALTEVAKTIAAAKAGDGKQLATVAEAETRRAELLGGCRQVVRNARNLAATRLLNGPDQGALELFELTTRLLSRRHYSEGDWRNEPVDLPTTRNWTGDANILRNRLM